MRPLNLMIVRTVHNESIGNDVLFITSGQDDPFDNTNPYNPAHALGGATFRMSFFWMKIDLRKIAAALIKILPKPTYYPARI